MKPVQMAPAQALFFHKQINKLSIKDFFDRNHLKDVNHRNDGNLEIFRQFYDNDFNDSEVTKFFRRCTARDIEDISTVWKFFDTFSRISQKNYKKTGENIFARDDLNVYVQQYLQRCLNLVETGKPEDSLHLVSHLAMWTSVRPLLKGQYHDNLKIIIEKLFEELPAAEGARQLRKAVCETTSNIKIYTNSPHQPMQLITHVFFDKYFEALETTEISDEDFLSIFTYYCNTHLKQVNILKQLIKGFRARKNTLSPIDQA